LATTWIRRARSPKTTAGSWPAELQRQRVAAGFDQRMYLFGGAGDHAADVDRFLLELDHAAGHARDVQQVVDQRGHVADLAPDHFA
jgi:hypothetical protein